MSFFRGERCGSDDDGDGGPASLRERQLFGVKRSAGRVAGGRQLGGHRGTGFSLPAAAGGAT